MFNFSLRWLGSVHPIRGSAGSLHWLVEPLPSTVRLTTVSSSAGPWLLRLYRGLYIHYPCCNRDYFHKLGGVATQICLIFFSRKKPSDLNDPILTNFNIYFSKGGVGWKLVHQPPTGFPMTFLDLPPQKNNPRISQPGKGGINGKLGGNKKPSRSKMTPENPFSKKVGRNEWGKCHFFPQKCWKVQQKFW